MPLNIATKSSNDLLIQVDNNYTMRGAHYDSFKSLIKT